MYIYFLSLQITSIICDMETQQVCCAFEHLKITTEKPFFEHPITKEPVYFIFDLPHLIKCLRNNLMSYDILVCWKFQIGTELAV